MEQGASSLVVVSLAQSHRYCRRDDYRYDLRRHHWLYYGSDGLSDFDYPACYSPAGLCDWFGDFHRADEDDSWKGLWRVPPCALGQADSCCEPHHVTSSDTVTTPNKPDGVNPAIASRFQSGYHWRGVTDPERYVFMNLLLQYVGCMFNLKRFSKGGTLC